MSPSTSQRFISSTEHFGRLLGETLNNETTKSVKARENIGNCSNKLKDK